MSGFGLGPQKDPGKGMAINWKMLVLQGLGVLACTALGVMLVVKMGGEVDFKDFQKNLRFQTVVFPALIYTTSWIMEGIRNGLILKALGEKVSYLTVTLAFVGGLFMAHLTPFVAGAAPLQMAFFAILGISTAKSGAMLVLGGLYAQGTLALTLLPVLYITGDTKLMIGALLYFGAVAAALICVFVFSGELKSERDAKKHQHDRKWLKAIVVSLKDVPPAMKLALKLPPGLTIATLFFTMAYHFFYIMTAPILFHLMYPSAKVDWLNWFGKTGSVLLFNSLSPSPGGAGTGEGLGYKIMGPLMGIKDQKEITSFILLWRMDTFHWATLAGFCCLIWMWWVSAKRIAARKPEVYEAHGPEP